MPLSPVKLNRSDAWAVLAIAALAFVCHLPALRADFAWDDFDTLVQNPHLDQSESVLLYFSPTFWRESHTALHSPYRPVREIVLALTWRAFGASAAAFHAVNLAGHSLNSALVYLAVLLLFSRRGLAALAAGVFALHPSHIETLAFVKNVGEILCVFFALVSILAFVLWARRMGGAPDSITGASPRSVGVSPRTTGVSPVVENEKPAPSPSRTNPTNGTWAGRPCCGGRGAAPWLLGLAAPAAYLVALLAKESAAAVPLVLTFWAAVFLTGRQRRLALLNTLPLWAIGVAYAAMQAGSPEIGARALQADVLLPGGAAQRLVLVGRTVLAYLWLLAFPFRHVPWREFGLSAAGPGLAAGVLLGLAALGAVWAWMLRRWRVGAMGLFWTVAALGPAANVVVNVLRPLAEQRLYFPSVGFAVLLAGMFDAASARREARAWARGAAALLAVVFVLAQVHGLSAWRSARSLWLHGVRHAPSTQGAYLNLADAYIAAGRYEPAESLLRQAHDLAPGKPGPLMNLGGVLSRMGRDEEAVETLRQAAGLFPEDPGIRNNIGSACFRRAQRLQEAGDEEGAGQWFAKAADAYREALALDPGNVHALANLGNCLLEAGRTEEAREQFEAALRRDRRFAEAHYNYGRLLLMEGDVEGAAQRFEAAAELNPNLPGVFSAIAFLREEAGELDAAERAWRRAAAMSAARGSPDEEASDWMGLAALLERRGKRAEAHEAWQRAHQAAGFAHPEIRAGLERTR